MRTITKYKIGIGVLLFILLIQALIILNFYTVSNMKIQKLEEEYSYLMTTIDTKSQNVENIILPTPSIEPSPTEVTPVPDLDMNIEPLIEDDVIYLELFEVNTEIDQISGLNSENYNQIILEYLSNKNIENSYLKNIGTYVWNGENEDNVNGLFVIAVALRSSENGTSEECIYRNNPFRFINKSDGKYKSYDTLDSAIVSFTKIIRTYYFNKNLTTIEKVSEKYAPLHSKSWENSVTEIYNELVDIANQL